jgi:hypothetical protein
MNLLDLPDEWRKCWKHDRPCSSKIDIETYGVLIKYACGCCLIWMEGRETK